MKASGLKKPTQVEKANPEASADNAPAAKPAKNAETAPKTTKAAADTASKVGKAADAVAKATKAAATDTSAKVTPTAEPAPDNDPIGLTMQYRDTLGGLNNQITDIEAQKKKMKVFRAPKLLSKGANLIDFVGENDKQEPSTDTSKPPVSAAAGISKIKKAVSATTAASKVIVAAKSTAAKKTTEETSVTVNENLAGANDPIA